MECDVVERTYLLAEATADAGVVHDELFVGDEESIKEWVGQGGLEPWGSTLDDIDHRVALQDMLCHLRESLADSVDFALGTFRGVEVETFDIDIGFWHDKAECGVEVPPLASQQAGKALYGAAHIVATGTSQVAIVGGRPRSQLTHKVVDKMGYGPTVDRTDDTYNRGNDGSVDLGEVDDRVVGETTQLLGYITAIATSGKVVNHIIFSLNYQHFLQHGRIYIFGCFDNAKIRNNSESG